MFGKEPDSVSEISTYSFFVYLLFMLIGIAVDLFFSSIPIFSSSLAQYIGVGLMIFSTLVIAWAAHGANRYRKKSGVYEDMTHEHLHRGVFRFTRNPSYLGLGGLILGFGFVSNSVFVVALAVISFVVVNAWFIPHEEKVLAKRHGDHFHTYKKKTRRWF